MGRDLFYNYKKTLGLFSNWAPLKKICNYLDAILAKGKKFILVPMKAIQGR